MSAAAAPGPRVGVRFEPDWPPEELPEFARWAESAGYDELWFSEDLPWAGGIAMAATALACTSELGVGLGLLPARTRNVATAAMEIAALARIAPGRLTVGLGIGVPDWMEQIGAETGSPLAALEETARALRGLLAGETVTLDGKQVRLQEVTLGFPPAEPPPILLGTTGPTGLAIAGRSADGVVLAELCTPEAVRWARAEMAAAGAAGTTVVFAMVSVDEERAAALAETRPRAQRLCDFGVFRHLTERAGLGADGAGELTDEVLGRLAASGAPDDCAAAVEGWFEAGASRIVLVAGADDARRSYARFAAEILPRLA